MIDVKLLNRTLWGINLLLGAGLVAFSFHFLVRAQDPREFMRDFTPDNDAPLPPVKPTDIDEGVLMMLSNPILRAEESNPEVRGTLKASLKGTLPNEKNPRNAVAFLRSPIRNLELVAYVGEQVQQEGKPFDDTRGWMLESVSMGRASFVNRNNERVTLSIDQTLTPPPTGTSAAPQSTGRNARMGQPYTSEAFKSRLLAQAGGQQVWGIDRDEIDWAAQNIQQILERDLQLSPYAGVGLRIEGITPRSIGALRGLLAGDVLKEVNGQSLNSMSDLQTMLSHQSLNSQAGLRLTIDRAGAPVMIEYRPLPR